MKSQIVYNIIVFSGFLFLFSQRCFSQLTTSNPAQYAAISEGNVKINSQVSEQTKMMLKTEGLQAGIITEFKAMKAWEQKYNSYMTTANGYAEAIVAGADLIAQGVMTLQRLHELQNTIGANPQGIAASIAMNDIYVDTAVKFIMTYRTMHEIGSSMKNSEDTNMLSGEDRTVMLWNVSDSLKELNSELHKLAISIAYYNLLDVWNSATRGIVTKTHGTIARESLNNWNRARKVNQILN